jgi:hypothetical protein
MVAPFAAIDLAGGKVQRAEGHGKRHQQQWNSNAQKTSEHHPDHHHGLGARGLARRLSGRRGEGSYLGREEDDHRAGNQRHDSGRGNTDAHQQQEVAAKQLHRAIQNFSQVQRSRAGHKVSSIS